MKHKFSINRYTLTFVSLVLCVIFSSCETEPKPKPKRAFIIAKTDNNSWTTSARIECDSVDMVSNTHAIYWIDGNKFNLHAKSSIKLFSNPYYVSP